MASTSGIKLDEKTKARLQALGQLRDRSPHWLMKHAILEYLDKEEQEERENRICRERWEEYLRTGVAIPHEEVRAWINKTIEADDGAEDEEN